MKSHSKLLGLMGLGACLVACGGHPIVGTWRVDLLTVNTSLAADYSSFVMEASFFGDSKLSIVGKAKVLTTATRYASCDVTVYSTNMNWSATTATAMSGVLTITSTSQINEQERANCANAADNLARSPLVGTSPVGLQTSNYSITNNQLVITNTGGSGMSGSTVTLTKL